MKYFSKKLLKNRWFWLVFTGFVFISLVAVSLLVYRNEKDSRKPSFTVVNIKYFKNKKKVEKNKKAKEIQTATQNSHKPEPTPKASQWPVLLTSEQASSITVVVNKKHRLPADYVPAGLTSVYGALLRAEAASAISSLFEEAKRNGFNLKIISGYRSYQSQASIYNSYVAQDGQAIADTYSARPGFSEHQTGLVADVGYISGECALETCFGDTPAGRWLVNNSHNFGFIIRYPSGKQAITGYQYEPWHLRYVGVDVAKAVYLSGLTLDQYYNVPSGGY